MAFLPTEGSSYFRSTRSGIDTFQSIVSRLVLRTVAIGSLIAAVLILYVHLRFGSGSSTNWLFLVVTVGLAALSWREAQRDQPRTLLPTTALTVVIVGRLVTADLFVAVALLVPLFAVGMMAAFSLPDRKLRVFTWVFFGLTIAGGVSYVVRFEDTGGVWRGIVAAGVGVALGTVLVALLRRENHRFVSQYESLYQGVSIGLVRITGEGQLIAANRKLTEMVGYGSVSEFDGEDVQSILFDQNDIEKATHLVRSGQPGELSLLHRNGSRIWVRARFNEVTDAAGTVLGYEGFVEDISESRRARAVARRAEARFGTVFESAPIGMALVDAAGTIIRANSAFGALAGVAGSVLTGTPWEQILGGQLGDPARFFDPDHKEENGEIDVDVPGGGRISLRLHVERPLDSDATDEFAIVQLLDVTSDVELQAVLRKQVRAKNDFIATVSHELRTPLTAVVGFLAELPGYLGEVGDEPAEMLEIVTAESMSLSNIVEDLLVAARADIDQLVVKTEMVPVQEVVERVGRASSRIIVDHGGSLDLSAVSADRALADAGRVEQILWNLIVNGVRHGGKNVAVGSERHGDDVVVWVRDDGPGIPDDVIDALFEPFSSFAVDRGVTSSMGLGLYVVHKLAQKMGGSITVGSRPGFTEFVLVLPAADVPAIRSASA